MYETMETFPMLATSKLVKIEYFEGLEIFSFLFFSFWEISVSLNVESLQKGTNHLIREWIYILQ